MQVVDTKFIALEQDSCNKQYVADMPIAFQTTYTSIGFQQSIFS